MKKSILNLGTPISRNSQKLILGGSGCSYGDCSGGQICYHNTIGGTYCGDYDQHALEVAPPETRPLTYSIPRVGTHG